MNTDKQFMKLKTDGTREIAYHMTLEEMQNFVGGYIEIVKMEDGFVAVVNEDGLLNQLQTNELYPQFVGNIIHNNYKI